MNIHTYLLWKLLSWSININKKAIWSEFIKEMSIQSKFLKLKYWKFYKIWNKSIDFKILFSFYLWFCREFKFNRKYNNSIFETFSRYKQTFQLLIHRFCIEFFIEICTNLLMVSMCVTLIEYNIIYIKISGIQYNFTVFIFNDEFFYNAYIKLV